MKPTEAAAIGLETRAIDPIKYLGAKDKWQKIRYWEAIMQINIICLHLII